MITIRPEQPQDRDAIRTLNERAFEGTEEADLVDALRRNDGVLLSLVAVQDDQVIGHILFSPLTIHSEHAEHCRSPQWQSTSDLPQSSHGVGPT